MIAHVFAWGVLLAWLLGLVGTDRTILSQLCSWLPGFLMIPVAFVGMWAARNRSMKRTWACVALLGPAWWLLIDQPLRPFGNEAAGLSLIQWTMSHDKTDRERHAQVIVELDADITILTHGYGVRGTPSLLEWLGSDIQPYKYGHFTILTKLPVRQIRSVATSNDISLKMIEIDTTLHLGRPLRILAVDFPSGLLRSRMELAENAHGWLLERGGGDVDVALGDFNMARNSAAIELLLPGMKHAWTLAGVGWGPTFPRSLPIYHIDHVLVADWINVTRARTIDPGIGRHRLQLVHLEDR